MNPENYTSIDYSKSLLFQWSKSHLPKLSNLRQYIPDFLKKTFNPSNSQKTLWSSLFRLVFSFKDSFFFPQKPECLDPKRNKEYIHVSQKHLPWISKSAFACPLFHLESEGTSCQACLWRKRVFSSWERSWDVLCCFWLNMSGVYSLVCSVSDGDFHIFWYNMKCIRFFKRKRF